MKVRDIPKSGRDGSEVHCHRQGTHYVRRHVQTKDRKTDARRRAREIMDAVSKGYNEWLTQPERDAWIAAAEKLLSRPRLGQSGHLAGQLLFVKLNGPRELIGRPWLRLPTEPVVFGPSPVGELTLRREPGRLRIELAISGPVTDDIMVLATPPCRATWKKCRKPRFLGLLPAPVEGVCDITALYLARFGDPEPGQRIFIRTIQQRAGWESAPVDTSNVVPARELCATEAPVQTGMAEGEHRTSNLRTVGAWSLGFGASLELGVWSLELSPPRAQGRYTVCTPWIHHGCRRSRGRMRRFGSPWSVRPKRPAGCLPHNFEIPLRCRPPNSCCMGPES